MSCRLLGILETLTLPAFWSSLVIGPLVVVDGHLYDVDMPRYRVEHDREHYAWRCDRCGQWVEQGWRRYWGVASSCEIGLQ